MRTTSADDSRIAVCSDWLTHAYVMGLALADDPAMRDTDPNLVPFDPEEFASSPFLDAVDDELDHLQDWSLLDIHERPTLVP